MGASAGVTKSWTLIHARTCYPLSYVLDILLLLTVSELYLFNVMMTFIYYCSMDSECETDIERWNESPSPSDFLRRTRLHPSTPHHYDTLDMNRVSIYVFSSIQDIHNDNVFVYR